MPNDFIKNPKRNNTIPVIKYIPEHERLGIMPNKFNAHQLRIDVKEESLKNTNDAFNNRPSFQVDGVEYNDNEIIEEEKFSDDVFTNIEYDLEKESKSIMPSAGDYLLMIDGNIICSGSIKIVEKKAQDILYGDDEEFKDRPINQEDMVVLKRVNLQIGVFIKD